MIRVLDGDCRAILATLPAASVHCCITSPPYFGLRDYGHAGQIGLEPTPDSYVAELVAVFRAVRRVLRDDGTVWLNLGDSYVSGNGAQVPDGKTNHTTVMRPGNPEKNKGASNRDGIMFAGLAPKNLIGIPWRVAFALQQPFYTGKIKDERDRIWLAAMIDAEGCMFIHKRKVGQNNGQGYARKADSFGSGLEVANTHKSIVDRCLAITGQGSICRQDKDRNQPLYRWNLRSNECREVIREIYPHLVAKQHQARLLIGCPSSGPKADAAHAGLMSLHNGLPCEADFPAPETMFEPGWCLRQDLIWHKLNPMPESVTDRCTKAHEYIFLLSKRPRYYFDAEAIAEPLTCEPHAPGNAKLDASRNDHDQMAKVWGLSGKRNRRSVWTVATQPFSGAHFATFPPDLIEPCILAGCPVGGTVLDPFFGAGTTGLVADRHGRNAIGIELNPEYAAMARERLHGDAGMFAEIAA